MLMMNWMQVKSRNSLFSTWLHLQVTTCQQLITICNSDNIRGKSTLQALKKMRMESKTAKGSKYQGLSRNVKMIA